MVGLGRVLKKVVIYACVCVCRNKEEEKEESFLLDFIQAGY